MTRNEVARVMDHVFEAVFEVDDPLDILLVAMREYDDEPDGLVWSVEALVAIYAQSEGLTFWAAKTKLQKQCHFMREAGQREYAHEEDNAFANFDRVARKMRLDRQKVLKVYLEKHLDGFPVTIPNDM